MKINVKKALLCGLIAGGIISISALTMIPVVGNEMDNVLINRGLSPLSSVAMVYFCGLSFVFGIALILLYAILKPQIKSWIKTAITVSIVVWILAYLFNNISLSVYGFMPVRLAIIGSIWGLMELLLGSIIASRIYERKTKSL